MPEQRSLLAPKPERAAQTDARKMYKGDVHTIVVAAHQHERPPPQNEALKRFALRTPLHNLGVSAMAPGIV